MTQKRARILWISAVLVLLVQAVSTYAFSRRQFIPSPDPLDLFPRALGAWNRSIDGVLDPEAYAMLDPDDVLNRRYTSSTDSGEISFFIGYYKTQLRAKNAHDPKVCLPGSGWEPTESITVPLAASALESAQAVSVTANRYVVKKGNAQAVVLYWFQTHRDGVAAEQALRFQRLIDVFREGRSDMALVRIVAPVGAEGVDVAAQRAIDFALLAYPHLRKQFPPRTKS